MNVATQGTQGYWPKLAEITERCGTVSDDFRALGKECVLNIPRVIDQLVSGAILSYRGAHDRTSAIQDDAIDLIHQTQNIWLHTFKNIFPQMKTEERDTLLAADALVMLSSPTMGGVGSALHVFQQHSLSAVTTTIKDILKSASLLEQEIHRNALGSTQSCHSRQTFSVALARSSFDVAMEGLKHSTDNTRAVMSVISSEISSGFDGPYSGINALYMLSARGVRVSENSDEYIRALNISSLARDGSELISYLNNRYRELREPIMQLFERVLMTQFSHAIAKVSGAERGEEFDDPLRVLADSRNGEQESAHPRMKEQVVDLVESRLARDTLKYALIAWQVLPEGSQYSSGFSLQALTALRNRFLSDA
jgi:hypothetical protein